MKKFVLLCIVLLCFLAGCQIPQYEQENPTTGIVQAHASDDQIGGWLRAGEIVAGVLCPELALLLGVAGTAYGAIKKAKLTVTDKKYQAHKKAGERIMRSSEPVASNEVYAIIGEERQKIGL